MLKRVALVMQSTDFNSDKIGQPYSDIGKVQLVNFHAVMQKVTWKGFKNVVQKKCLNWLQFKYK